MPRILTGIQSSGKPHLGNILGAIEPALSLSKAEPSPAFFFIADLHTLTSTKNGAELKANVDAIAAAWLACGMDTQKDVFYRQSRVTEVCELTWILNCFTPFPMLANSHSFKDKSESLADVNAGLFTYPVLMTADILICNADWVPVGKDQKQHLEIARDIGTTFNRIMGETFVLPEAKIAESVMTIPGTDGRKMSKSYKNYIDIFAEEKELKKAVMSVVTDSTPMEEPKNPDVCNVFALYSTIAKPAEIAEMRELYIKGGFGYGHAKTRLFEALLSRFANERAKYNEFISKPDVLESELIAGEKKARVIAQETLSKVKKSLGIG